MVLASAYLGGAWFFIRVVRERRWARLSAGLVSVTLFAALLGVATVIHWDRFNHGHVAFWLWAGLYFTAPFLVLAVWVANQRVAAPPTRTSCASAGWPVSSSRPAPDWRSRRDS
jgi:hypothetical protein